jgi:hypothetical protein
MKKIAYLHSNLAREKFMPLQANIHAGCRASE